MGLEYEEYIWACSIIGLGKILGSPNFHTNSTMRVNNVLLMLFFGYSFAFDIAASSAFPPSCVNLMSSTLTPLHTSKISPKSALTRVKRGGYLPSTSSLILPSCASSRVLKVAFQAGVVCLSSQLVLQSAFKRSKDPLLNTNPGYLAHTCVALPLMAFVSGVGSVGWWLKGRPETAMGRIMNGSDEAR